MTERKRHKKRMRARAANMGGKYTQALRTPAASVVGQAKLSDVADPAPEIVLGPVDAIADDDKLMAPVDAGSGGAAMRAVRQQRDLVDAASGGAAMRAVRQQRAAVDTATSAVKASTRAAEDVSRSLRAAPGNGSDMMRKATSPMDAVARATSAVAAVTRATSAVAAVTRATSAVAAVTRANRAMTDAYEADNLLENGHQSGAQEDGGPGNQPVGDDPTILELEEREPFAQELEKHKDDPKALNEFLFGALERARTRPVEDRPVDNETFLARLVDVDENALPLTDIAHRFATDLNPYFGGGGALNLKRSQVLEWVRIRLAIKRQFPSQEAFFSYVCAQPNPGAFHKEIALMLADNLHAYFGGAVSTLPKARVMEGFTLAVATDHY